MFGSNCLNATKVKNRMENIISTIETITLCEWFHRVSIISNIGGNWKKMGYDFC